MLIWIIALVVIALFVMWSYNWLVSKKNQVEWAYADIDVQMKMRFDLVENLVNTVKWYATHEKDTLDKLTQARTQWMQATTTADKASADGMLTWALKTLFATSEAYPDLKANTNFLDLQQKLTEIETTIAGARRFYNATVKEFNVALQSFPNNILAWYFNFKAEKDYFETTTPEERLAPKVQF